MGKHSHRRRKHRSQQKDESANSGQGTSTLIKRLRHGDAQVRHGALAALAATLMHPEELERSLNRKIAAPVLQAVLERIMDGDLECSQAAAGCLANYVSFAKAQTEESTAGWTLVLLGRLQQCREALGHEETNKSDAMRRQWWAVSVQCFHALCALVEMNPQALERIMSTKAMEFVEVLLGHLTIGRQELESRRQGSVAALPSDKQQDEEVIVEWIRDVTVYAVRTLHSALDDNVNLLLLWMQHGGSDASFRQGLDLLLSSCTCTFLPPPTHLHAAGCLVSVRQLLLILSHENEVPDSCLLGMVQNQVQTTVVPLLMHHLQYNVQQSLSLMERIVESQKAYAQEQADNALEQQVIENVNRRKEPARLIARRQKQLKEQQEENSDMKKEQDLDEAMQEDQQEEENHDGKDCRENLERARQAWHSALVPMHLALEISANLTGGFADNMERESNPMEADDNMLNEDWGPTQEAQLLERQRRLQTASSGEMNSLDKALTDALVQQELPDRFVVLLKGLCTPLSPLSSDTKTGTTDESLPVYVTLEISDLISKCSGCVGNCMGSLAEWRSSEPILVWKELVQLLQALLPSSSEASNDAVEGIGGAMVVALRSRPLLRSQIQQDDLDFLVSLLQSSSFPSMQRNAVCMLGVLCISESHSKAVNTKVCSSLLAVLTTSSVEVQSEALDALMDIYGEDDRHPDVFDSLDVLGHFQRTLPKFKKRCQGGDGAATEEVDQWKETALNASRFIQYKKGEL